MLGSVALLSDVVVTTTPLTNLRVIFLSDFSFVMTFACLVILPVIVPFPLEILFEFLANKFLLSVLTIVVNFRQK
jgi:hypothetical protein